MIHRISLRFFSSDVPVLSKYSRHLCHVKLNRPKSLNSMNIEMFDVLMQNLKDWDQDKDTCAVLVTGEGEKAFSAGGDIKSVYEAKQKDPKSTLPSIFFRKEYVTDYGFARMRPIQISVWDGITMGGGAGITIHSPIRIATERSIFAMPECGIGLYPDVGSSYFLSRLPGSLGLYLAVTGSRLNSTELVQAGVATHYVPSDRIADLTEQLIEKVNPHTNVVGIKKLVDKFAEKVDENNSFYEEIEKHFGGVTSLEEIHTRCAASQSNFGKKTYQDLMKLSPVSQKVAFEQIRRGIQMSLEEVFTMEYRISMNFAAGDDVYEGVRAILVDKDKCPKWSFKSVFEVPDKLIMQYFERPSSPDFKDLYVRSELRKFLEMKRDYIITT
ncbi:unnamed protein product [Blepharisma stoltei]|uniref:3-hydroxyisobutyryl-CoA hydrolase n=1 Tax=Blepharisma stoltei TaxID=1481888 RepID=A0AAU9I8W7_9CILI|nr:unnamed protein product [Blepharisma stoltei]